MYVAENGTFDGSAFSAFPISGWYWKVLARTYDEVTNEQLLCVKVEGQVVPIWENKSKQCIERILCKYRNVIKKFKDRISG